MTLVARVVFVCSVARAVVLLLLLTTAPRETASRSQHHCGDLERAFWRRARMCVRQGGPAVGRLIQSLDGNMNCGLQTSSPFDELDDLQRVLGHDFDDVELLRRALTHPSYFNEHPEQCTDDNQRLEFLGDAVLDFVAGAWVYRHYPEFDEGRMTRLRAALVRTEALAGLARRVGVGEALLLGRGEREAGGWERDANLCDSFEAVVGALYLDGGTAVVEAFVEPLIGPVAGAILAADTDRDAKSKLQEWSQAELGMTPRYRIAAEQGPDHLKTFEAEVLLGDQVLGRGTGRSKQTAEQAAARAAWSNRTHGRFAGETRG